MPDLSLFPDLFATPHRFLWHPATRTAILADFHLGIESTLADQGLSLPNLPSAYFAPLERAWQHLLSRNPSHLIIAGDLFDSPKPPASAIDQALTLLRQLPASCSVTLTPGNHDPAAAALAVLLSGPAITIRPAAILGQALISHGHELPPDLSSASTWIVGHQHPAVTFSTRIQSAKMPCYAQCAVSSFDQESKAGKRAAKKSLIILPTFSTAPLGSNLLVARHWLLPIPRPANANIQVFGLIEPATAQPQVLHFGPLSAL